MIFSVADLGGNPLICQEGIRFQLYPVALLTCEEMGTCHCTSKSDLSVIARANRINCDTYSAVVKPSNNESDRAGLLDLP